jgi:hypothetical protein
MPADLARAAGVRNRGRRCPGAPRRAGAPVQGNSGSHRDPEAQGANAPEPPAVANSPARGANAKPANTAPGVRGQEARIAQRSWSERRDRAQPAIRARRASAGREGKAGGCRPPAV